MLTNEDRIRLLGFRVRHDINQLHFSKGIISRNQLSNIENGKSSTTEKVLFQLYLRFCEYMLALNDYNRFDFNSLVHYEPYKNLQSVLDLYDELEKAPLTNEKVNQINLTLNHHPYGLINMFVLEKVGDWFVNQGDLENAFSFYLKGYYVMTAANIDEINAPKLECFMKKVIDLGLTLRRHFNVVEVLDHLDHIKSHLYESQSNCDYLFDLASAYQKMSLPERAIEVCKRIELINFNQGNISKSIVGKSFHLLGNLYHSKQMTEQGTKYYEKAHKLFETIDEREALRALQSDMKKFTA